VTEGTTRLETFSDGVFAIAATILVLEIGVDHTNDLGRALLDLWPSYLAYATSFVTIGIIWINHHNCVRTIERIDRPFMFINMLFLLVVAFIPFPTKLVAEYLQEPGERAAVYAYDAVFIVMAIVYTIWWRYASTRRRLIGDDVSDGELRAITRAFNPGIPLYAIAFAVAFFSPLASVLLNLAIAAFYLPSAALFAQR
jgi:uncharacterized membrane protein